MLNVSLSEANKIYFELSYEEQCEIHEVYRDTYGKYGHRDYMAQWFINNTTDQWKQEYYEKLIRIVNER